MEIGKEAENPAEESQQAIVFDMKFNGADEGNRTLGFSLEDISAEFGESASTLTRFFKRSFYGLADD